MHFLVNKKILLHACKKLINNTKMNHIQKTDNAYANARGLSDNRVSSFKFLPKMPNMTTIYFTK